MARGNEASAQARAVGEAIRWKANCSKIQSLQKLLLDLCHEHVPPRAEDHYQRQRRRAGGVDVDENGMAAARGEIERRPANAIVRVHRGWRERFERRGFRSLVTRELAVTTLDTSDLFSSELRSSEQIQDLAR
jgi:hypothetical protein